MDYGWVYGSTKGQPDRGCPFVLLENKKRVASTATLFLKVELTGQAPIEGAWTCRLALLVLHQACTKGARNRTVGEAGIELADHGTGFGNDVVNSRHASVEGCAEGSVTTCSTSRCSGAWSNGATKRHAPILCFTAGEIEVV